MKTSKTTEAVLIILTLIPLLYLAGIYTSVADQVPMHFDASGNADRYGHKSELWIIPLVLNVSLYLLFKYFPKLDSKKQFHKMENKYTYVRMALTLFLTVLSCGIIFISTSNSTEAPVNWLYGLTGLMFIFLGNYMPAMKPNYFIGIRTPWTLENETVWRKTHQVGAWVFIASGFLIILSCFLLSNFAILFVVLGITIVIVLFSTIYSYLVFKKLNHE
ncbi:SdpI family protein [Nonlabens antarcticus]|uniref:SdpI family protein n=1 Tax=Nonlabens antarcticus TaxID=392714 RepID=UPI001891AA87|nr:SdpI family protein [Nonlabens antarcticus]